MPLRGTEPEGSAAERDGARWADVTGVATAAMATGMLALYAVSTLGPFLVTDLGLPRSAVGALVTATFVVACAGSLVAGRVVDAAGPRRGVLGLAVLVLAGLLAAALAPGYGWLPGRCCPGPAGRTRRAHPNPANWFAIQTGLTNLCL